MENNGKSYKDMFCEYVHYDSHGHKASTSDPLFGGYTHYVLYQTKSPYQGLATKWLATKRGAKQP